MSDRYQFIESQQDAVADVITIDIPEYLRWDITEVSVVPYDNVGLVCDPTAGTFTVTAKTAVNDSFEAVEDGVIDAATITTVAIGGTVQQVRVTPAAVSGDSVTNYKVRVVNRRSA
jgi:hypothetical protein